MLKPSSLHITFSTGHPVEEHDGSSKTCGFFLGMGYYFNPEFKKDLRVKNKKNCLPKRKSERVHLPIIKKTLTFGASLRRYGAPVAIVL